MIWIAARTHPSRTALPHYREAWEASSGRRYANFFAEVVPKVARPFLEELLSLVLRKAEASGFTPQTAGAPPGLPPGG